MVPPSRLIRESITLSSTEVHFGQRMAAVPRHRGVELERGHREQHFAIDHLAETRARKGTGDTRRRDGILAVGTPSFLLPRP